MDDQQSGAGESISYGWTIAVLSAVGLAFGISVLMPTTTSLLVGPLGKSFGWTPPQIYFGLACNTVMTLLAAPLTGRIVDKIGPRRVIVFAYIAETLLIASFYFLDANIYGLYLRYAAFALLSTGTTAVAYSTLISLWFDRRRGMALGLALAGVGVGGVIWSLLTQYLFDAYGWRTAFLYLAAFVGVLILPVQLLFIREPRGTSVRGRDGQVRLAEKTTRQRDAAGATLKEALADGRFWLILATFFLITCATYGVMLNLVPLLVQRGSTPQTAAAAQASIWLALVFGRLSTGWLMDRFFAPYVAFAFGVPCLAGIGMLALGVDGSLAFVAAMLVGLAAGAEIDVLAYVVGRYFGLRHFGAIYAPQFAAVAVATSAGPLLVSVIAGREGNYVLALGSLGALLCVASVLLLLFPRFRMPTAGGEKVHVAE